MTDDGEVKQPPPRARWAIAVTALLCLVPGPARASEVQEITLAPWTYFDLESGQALAADLDNPIPKDLMWGCGPQEIETFRAMSGVSWTLSPDGDFAADRQTVESAAFAAPVHPSSNYPELFRLPTSLTKSQIDRVYFLRTAEGNFAKLRIAGFDPAKKEPALCRSILLQYELLP